jgi:anthranilate phosphoribosyltransferase
VLANSAAALLAARQTDDPRVAVEQAAAAIDSGGARGLVQRLAELSQRV